MKVLPFEIPKPKENSIIFQKDYESNFYDKLHQHKEIQISLIVEGEGTLIVGDTVNHFTKGNILIIGSNIPHVFKSDVMSSKASHMLTLFFTSLSLGNTFFELDDLKELKPFFARAKQGFKLISQKKLARELFYSLEHSSKLEKLIILLKLLKICSKAEFYSLSSLAHYKKFSVNEGKRMRNVFEYTINNYEMNISLHTISEVANMTKNAFCKYFKKRTNKTYNEFLNDLRIEKACKLIMGSEELTISQIAVECGYNNLSNFNRQFKKRKYKSPSSYKESGYNMY